MKMDRVIETPDGFDCIVGGRQFGTWATRAMARGAMRVEQDRALRRVAVARASAAQRALDVAKRDRSTALARIGFLRSQLIQAERALADLNALTIPAPPVCAACGEPP